MFVNQKSKVPVAYVRGGTTKALFFTFAQVGVQDDSTAYSADCGNISAGVGPFEIDEKLVNHFRNGVSLDPTIKTQEIKFYNTNTERVLVDQVPVDEDGPSISAGKFTISGVPGTDAPILFDYREVRSLSRTLAYA